MIAENQRKITVLSWQTELSNAITDPAELLELLELNTDFIKAAKLAAQHFPLRVPRNFVQRMEKGNPNDPLLRQVLPLLSELELIPGYQADAVGDKQAIKIPGLLHKYHGRVLLMMSGACAINCRYCFRREFPYAENTIGRKQWQQVLEYIANDNDIEEVIFSGGDPLVASDKRLATMVKELAEITHLKRLRIHTRLPIVLPSRITADFLAWFTQSRLQPILVMHCNHAQEINTSVRWALLKLRQAGVMLYNQAVLLKKVNDNIDALVNLQKILYGESVQPYYLHMLDNVQGAAHFAVRDETAIMLHKKLQQQLPGYLVPKLVREIEGELAKTIIR